METPQLRIRCLHRRIHVLMVFMLCTPSISATTVTTVSDDEVSTLPTTAEEESATTPKDAETTTTPVPPRSSAAPFTIRVAPMEETHGKGVPFETIPAQLTDYIYELKEGDLQDIGAEESNNNLLVHLEPGRFQPPAKGEVEVTSFVADSETALNMNVEEAVADVRNRSGGADMISAFFVAPGDEVYANNLDRRKMEDRGDTFRSERYSEDANVRTKSIDKDTLHGNILAPLQAAVSLSHERNNERSIPILEKQILKEMPVYKTTIEIQKSIPYEIKGGQMQAVKEEPQKQQQYTENSVSPPVAAPIMFAYQVPQYRTPVYYKYPTTMYYLPQSYIGNYIMRNSHQNTGGGVPAYYYRPKSYYYLRYPTTASGNLFAQEIQYQVPYAPAYHTPSANIGQGLPEAYQNIGQYPAYQDFKTAPVVYQDTRSVPAAYQDTKSVPATYQDTKSVSVSALGAYDDERTVPSASQDVKGSYNYDKYNSGAYENEKTVGAVYQVINTLPQTDYQDVSVVPGYQDLKSLPSSGEQDPKSDSARGYQGNIPLTYQTLKVVPASYTDIRTHPDAYPYLGYLDETYREDDQNTLQSEQAPKFVKLDQVADHPNQIPQAPSRAPFRPSQHVYSSVYPPYTYRVPLVLTAKGGRGIHARSVRSKQLCVEYGGFKPPMVPSVQIDEKGLPQQQAQEKSAVVEEEATAA